MSGDTRAPLGSIPTTITASLRGIEGVRVVFGGGAPPSQKAPPRGTVTTDVAPALAGMYVSETPDGTGTVVETEALSAVGIGKE
jgi:hypothetical protein